MLSADICASFRVPSKNRSIFGNAPVFVHNETPPMIRHDSQSKSDMEKGRNENRETSETATLLGFRACLYYTIGTYVRHIGIVGGCGLQDALGDARALFGRVYT